MSSQKVENGRPALSRTATYANGFPTMPASSALPNGRVAPSENGDAVLELNDGSAYQGISFGAPGKSVAGECVFQTGESSRDIRRCLALKVIIRHGGLHGIANRPII